MKKIRKEKMTDKKTPTLAQAGGFKLNNKIIAKKIQNINKKRTYFSL